MKAKGQIHFMRCVSAGAIIAASITFSPSAHAQLGNQSTIADPGRASQELGNKPQLQPEQATPNITVKTPEPLNAPKGAEKVTFVLKGIQIDGNTIYSDDQLSALYQDRIGTKQSLADVYTIANQIMLKYRNAGYILTQVVVPPQEIGGDGVAKLRVVEGFINKITLQKSNANASVDMANIQHYADQIKTGTALNVKDLERELLIINDLPGVTARSILSPSDVTGGADMLIVVDYDSIDGLVSLDNYGSRYLGPTQGTVAGTLNSWLGMNEAITAQAVLAPINSARELAYGALSYEQPIGTWGTKFHVTGSVTDTDPGWDLQQFDVRGHAWDADIGLTHPFIRSRNENLLGRLNLDWRKVKSSNNIEDTRTDRIVSLRAGGRYEFLDQLLGIAANTVDVEVSKGLSLFGTSEEGDANMSRALADPQATKMEAEIQRLQRITGSVNLLLAARGQWASNALLSSEEFGIGGINGGRGYDPSEVTGDEGIAGKVELQWKDPVKFDTNFLESYQLYTFYDVGTVWNDDATTSAFKRDSIASVGLGIRFDLPFDVEGGLAVAKPLTREVATQSDKDPKVYFNLSKRF